MPSSNSTTDPGHARLKSHDDGLEDVGIEMRLTSAGELDWHGMMGMHGG